MWTDEDEVVFQELLKRRQAETQRILNSATSDQMDNVVNHTDEYDPNLAWENYINYVSPEQLKTDLEYLEGV